jgi:hypothetical protein
MATYTYKRWFPSRLVIDGRAIGPAFGLGVGNRCSQDEKRQEQPELLAWESEGGNPESRSVAVQACLLAAPGQDTDR